MFGSLARACSAALRTRRTAAGTSRNVTFAESEDGVGIGDGLGRIGGREVVARHPAIEAVGVAGGNVVPVEPARRIEQRRREGGPLPQARRQRNDGVAPGFAAEGGDNGCHGLFCPLLGREAGPLVEGAGCGVARQLQVAHALREPVGRSVGHDAR